MDRKTVIALLKRHQAELTELGIVSLSIIGSTAREEATTVSDVDLAATLTPGPRGFAHLERMDQLRERLGKMLGCADGVVNDILKPLSGFSRRQGRDCRRVSAALAGMLPATAAGSSTRVASSPMHW